MKIGIFGGTFNPVHNGHINLINSFDSALNFDKIICIPANIPPHKENQSILKGEYRFKMAKLAFKDNKKIEVSDIELKSNEKSYTYNTLIKLKDLYKKDDLFLLMGSDMFLSFDKWFKFKDIFSLATICVASRENDNYNILVEKADEYKKMGGKTVVIKNKVKILSSSEVREKINKNISIKEDVPKSVFEYIIQNGFYTPKL